MLKQEYSRQFRVSLQLKSVLVIACVVSFAAGSGGWFYFRATDEMLRSEDHRRALRIGQALGLAIQRDVQNRRRENIQRLVSEYLRNENIRYVAVMDADREVIASARHEGACGSFSGLMSYAPSVSAARRDVERDVLLLAHPIVLRDSGEPQDSLVGAVRLVLDTSATTDKLAAVRRRMAVVAAAIVLIAIPLGYLLVWRVMVQPLRKLVSAARRLGEGDFSSRALLMRNDELGELAEAFDNMACEVAGMRDELVMANEQLERKVAARTEDLEESNRRLRQEMES